MTSTADPVTMGPGAEARAAVLRQAAIDKRGRAVSKAEAAIREMTARGEEVNFRSVARVAGVSVNFLYRNERLNNQITRLRASRPSVTQPGTTADIPSTNNVIRTLAAQLAAERAARRDETTLLRRQLAAAHGELLLARRAGAADVHRHGS